MFVSANCSQLLKGSIIFPFFTQPLASSDSITIEIPIFFINECNQHQNFNSPSAVEQSRYSILCFCE